MEIVYQVRGDGVGVTFARRSDAEYVAQIWKALDNSKTWGEFRANLPVGEWAANMAAHFEDIPLDDEPFDANAVPGYLDGDYPQWLRQVAFKWLPQDLIEQYGEVQTSVLNGDFLDIPVEKLDQVVDALRALGHEVSPTDLYFGWSV